MKSKSGKKLKKDMTILGRQVLKPARKKSKTAAVKPRNCIADGCQIMKGETLPVKEFGEYLVKLVNEVWDAVDAGLIDMDSAWLGYDVSTGANIWNYGALLGQLIKVGYCRGCADNFLRSFAQVQKDDGHYENMLAMTREFEKIVQL